MTELRRFAPRVLWLANDASCVRAQLAGAQLTREQAGALRDDISTDEISPLPAMVHFDETLGRYPYTGFAVQGQRPIGVDAIRHAGIAVVVGGQRYGKGSSREHSVVAELSAGVRLVIAESFERIYRQNADNAGLFTSTDFGLIERIRNAEAIPLDELLAGRDALAAAILRAGGLLRYGRACALAFAAAPAPDDGRPMTLFDKIVARHALATPDRPAPREVGEGGFVRADLRFIHEYYTAMAAHLLDAEFGDALALHDKSSIVCFEDHLSYVHRSPVHVQQGLVGGVRALSQGHRAFVARHGLTDHGYLQALEAGDAGNTGSQGISHAMVAEQYALPGQLIVGTDSHTPHSGALGCVAFGVGTTDMAFAFVNGAVRFTKPPQLRVDFEGQLPAGLTAKDLVLHLLAREDIRAGAGVGRVFEFGGTVVQGLSIDERATLTNMVAELGGFTGLVAPDEETVRFLHQRRGMRFDLQPWMCSDAGTQYEQVIAVDCSRLSPMVARPGDPGNGMPLAALAAPVRVDIAYGGSCTAGKREDFDHYHAVLAWAASRGLRVAPGVTLYLQFGTAAVRDYCVERGYLEAFESVGAELLQPACGACANCGPGVSTEAAQVTVSAINRNFPGRSGPGQVWLASPPTVAASAIAGELMSFADLQLRA
ncbi:aconitase family protein [Aquabacterium sp.]|uniref:aconitase family protein n=1 Tax=Aquabacterium sp. TaxID=1872578 RepID=UPI002CA7C7A7|nr:aconitase family protein [Aquabacterium sp.]HSW07378.1 aconitase family protein [Aquabacterium sp.]